MSSSPSPPPSASSFSPLPPFSLFLKENRTDERNQKFNIIVRGRLLQRKVTYISVLSLPSRPRGHAPA